MTKVLFITNKTDLTTDFVVREVQKKRVDFYRLNTEEIGSSVFITLDISNDAYYLYDRLLGIKYDFKSFTSVYFRRPEVRKVEDEDLTGCLAYFSVEACFNSVNSRLVSFHHSITLINFFNYDYPVIVGASYL